ncbi:MAG: PAS domain S-box protein [Kiritimatiellia bacterium]|nr:PAS domain S-box protein [Kiritimatiellia bacterium]
MARVMVVDDEKGVRITLGLFLENCGHHVVTAQDVNTACTLLEREAFDVVISDVLLPGVTGVELLKRVKTVDSNVQVVMMTGQPSAETASEIVRCDAFDYLLKPISKAKVIETVARAATMKCLLDEKRDLEEQNRRHREDLAQLVAERTRGLAESEERFRAITSAARDAIFMVDGDCRIQLWNPAAETILGYTAEEAIGKNAKQFFPELCEIEGPGECLRSKDSDTGNAGLTFEVTAERKDASTCPMELSVSRVHFQDSSHAVVIGRDITERRKATAAMVLAKEKAEAADRAKSEFLADMSHEIRTPMNAIIGMAELALDTSLTQEQRECLDTVMSSAEALLGLINELLDFSKIEAGKLELESSPFNLHTLIEDTARALAVRAQLKGLVRSSAMSALTYRRA